MPLQAFHRNEDAALLLSDLVNRADIRMLQSRGGEGFPIKAFLGVRIAYKIVGEELQSHKPAQFQVFCFVNDTHPATTEGLDPPVVRNGLSGYGLQCRHGPKHP
jgi:hypothetical protein